MSEGKTMQEFTLDKINNYKMFYILKKLNVESGKIVLSHQQSLINDVVNTEYYDLYKTQTGKVIVAFKEAFQNNFNYNYVASNGLVEEVVPCQSYERIMQYYRVGPEPQSRGGFAWSNSEINKHSTHVDWRCDNQKYGPMPFADVTAKRDVLFQSAGEIEIYETILNVVGVGHLIYVKRTGDIDSRSTIFNGAPTPFATHTLSEAIKLILEWASVATPEWKNLEPIAQKARQFVNKLGLNNELVIGQPDMQVYEYIKGNEQARLRPNGVQPMTEKLDKFIQNNISYMTFSKLASAYPEDFNLAQTVWAEQTVVQAEWESSLERFGITETLDFNDVDAALEYLSVNIPNNVMFATLYYKTFTNRINLLQSLAVV